MNTTEAGIVITLHPGDVMLGVRGDTMQTLLGSCVAVVLTDPRRTVGAMCHIVHAKLAPKSAGKQGAYAHVALRMMSDLLHERGLVTSRCEAHVYGGGNMFPDLYPDSSIGDHNVQTVLHALDQAGVQVLTMHTGGATYRKLSWLVGSDLPQVVAVSL
jgi:chemotaxis protein CheD